MTPAVYLDSSALLKLVRAERETEALRAFLNRPNLFLTSAVATVEVRRAAGRHGRAAELEKADDVLKGVIVIRLTDDILERAASLDPPQLRSLDAIHLATALSLLAERAVEITDFVVYDRRLAVAARALGLNVASPGA